MRILKDRLSDPPGGWRYHVEQTDYWVGPGHTFDHLLQAVRQHLLVNGIDIPEDLPVLVDAQIAGRVSLSLTKEV